MAEARRPDAGALLAELGYTPRLTVYLGGTPGAGKTHRLLADALDEMKAGRRVAIGWTDTKGRPRLDALASQLPRIPARTFVAGTVSVPDFDLDAALASDYETIVLDELAHANPSGARHAKRWQDALALRDAGKSVLGAFNVMHLETVAPVAERVLGHPVRELVPRSFLRAADRVIALDAAPSIIESRLRTGLIVRDDDVERAAAGAFHPRNVALMRELLLRTVDDLTQPVVAARKVSTALAVVTTGADLGTFLRRAAAFADAADLALETTAAGGADEAAVRDATVRVGGGMIAPPHGLARGTLDHVRASLLILAPGSLAQRVLSQPLDRDVLVLDPVETALARRLSTDRGTSHVPLAERLRVGRGKLTIFLGSAAGSGKTWAMLDRAHHLIDEEGVDVVAALVETHGRADTEARLAGIEQLARLRNGEMDVPALLRRSPRVALIDELAHTNAPSAEHAKRFGDVAAVLRAGIDVMTTLNVQHLEGVSDAVERLTGTHVTEKLPDSILELADDVVFIDVTPDVLRQRLRAGKVYPLSRVDAALEHFFRTENLAALRELTVREILHAARTRGHEVPFGRVVVAVSPRARDVSLVERGARIAKRLAVELRVVTIVPPEHADLRRGLEALERAAHEAFGAFVVETGADPARRMPSLVSSGDVLIVESARTRRRPFARRSFAVRVLDAGVREMLVLAPPSDAPVTSRR